MIIYKGTNILVSGAFLKCFRIQTFTEANSTLFDSSSISIITKIPISTWKHFGSVVECQTPEGEVKGYIKSKFFLH